MEAKETLYRYALEHLNDLHDGDEIFESVCHEIVKFLLPDYCFTRPSGGNGPRDGGRDGFDVNKNCRMACAIRVDYEKKLVEEIAKCNQERELFFFSNQKISETQKIKLENQYKSKVHLKIFSWGDLAESVTKIPNTLEFKKIRISIDELLEIQKLTFDFDCENFKIIPQNIDCTNNIYNSKIIVNKPEGTSFFGKNPLITYFESILQDNRFSEIPNFYVKGVFGIGKTTSLKILYNSFLQEKTKKWSRSFLPLFYSLKNFPESPITIPSLDNKFICFLDGIDEISDAKQLKLLRTIANYIDSDNIRFILSGRDAGFNSDTESYFNKKATIIKMVPYIDPSDTELIQLLAKLGNSPLKRMVPIPVFRKFFSNDNEIKDLTPKAIYDKVILDPLKTDCQRYFQSIDVVDFDVRESFCKKIVETFTIFCYNIFQEERSSFSQKYLKTFFSGRELDYLPKSVLLDFQSSESISFHNHFYYEYFVARYFVDRIDLIKSHLIKKGQINPKNLNIVQIILETSENQILLCNQMTECMTEMTAFSLMLKIKHSLVDEVRFNTYKKIYEYFCEQGRFIYYISFNNRSNQFSDIDSLSDEMYELLPDQYKTDAMTFLSENVLKCIENINAENIIRFANAVVLLGVWERQIWNNIEQKDLKNISTKIISFFLNNKEKLKLIDGFLSDTIILSWYKTYGWTKGWSAQEWNTFLKQIFPNSLGFGNFENYEEYHLQLEIFNNFSDDGYIKLFAKPLCIEIMKRQCCEDHHADIIPDEIDDNFKTPYIHTDGEVNSFIYSLKEGKYLSADDTIDIINDLIHTHINFHSTNYEFGKLKKIIFDFLQSNGQFVSIDRIEKIYEIISYTMAKKLGLNFYEIEPSLNFLSDQIKQTLLDKILQNLETLAWNRDWYFWGLISLLLDISETLLVKNNLQLVQEKITEENYNSLLMKIYTTVEKDRPLYKAIKLEYEKKFATRIQEKKELDGLLAKLEKVHIEKLSQESLLFLEPSKIIEEINAIEDFFKNNCTNGVPIYDFVDLEYENIVHNIRCEINFKCKHIPIFSDFVVKFLQPFETNAPFSIWFEKARDIIKKCFSDDNNFWIGFYDCYVSSHSDDDVRIFLKANGGIKQKIVDTMAEGVRTLQESLDIQQIISLNHLIWITPFIRYVQIIFNGNIPEYVDRNRFLSIVAYPKKYLVSQTSLFKNQAAWGNYNSAFDWLHNVAGFEYSEIVNKSLEIYPQTDNLYVKMQLLSDLIEHLDCHEREIVTIVLNETRRIFAKPEKSNAGIDFRYASLPEFWQKADKKYLAEIINEIPFEKYGLRHENPCLGNVIEYALKYISTEQKKSLIAKYKKYKDNEMKELLRRLGSKKEILRKISEYFHDGKCNSNFGNNNAHLFGFVEKNICVLIAYWRLFDYSMKKESERRSALTTIATKGLKEHMSPLMFKFFKIYMNWKIKQRKKAGRYVEWLYSFIEELEQKVYSK
jgi:hypothetical protein